jgi:predicted nucleotide-binding protein
MWKVEQESTSTSHAILCLADPSTFTQRGDERNRKILLPRKYVAIRLHSHSGSGRRTGMAKRKTSSVDGPKQPSELLMARDEARSRIEERIQKGRELRSTVIRSHDHFEATQNEYYKWNSFNTELLNRIFTTGEFADEYTSWVGVGLISVNEPPLNEKVSDLVKDINGKIHRLDSIIERLELIPLVGSTPVTPGLQTPNTQLVRTNKVFIVHGHDELSKTSLEVLLREFGLEPVVLHRQADEGLTVIEKFEKHSDVGYAFIVLTPDEIAYLKADDVKDDAQRKKEKRARPNVIFEFGYFVGKLGRSRVCCLHTGDVSLPSDVNGMIYKKYVASVEEVALSIIKDLNASGYRITVA